MWCLCGALVQPDFSPRDTCDDDSRRFSDTSRGGSRGLARTSRVFRIRLYLRNAPPWLGGLLSSRIKKESPETKPKELDELDAYLADEDVPDLNDSVLKWWKVRELKWPNLSKMVKQYMAAPCSGGGVERVFSAAGKMHGDLSKSAKDDTLEHSLFAAVRPHGQCEICGGCVR